MATKQEPSETWRKVTAAAKVVEKVKEDRELATLIEEQKKRKIRGSMLTWSEHRLAPLRQAPAKHHKIIIDALEDVVAGRCDRLMICAPPGSAKSTYTTKLFVPYWLAKYPKSNIISASHTSGLASKFGREVRNMVDEEAEVLGFGLREDSRAVDSWTTTHGGEYVAVGVGVAIAGIRADLVLIDDPFKGREDADSATQREKVWSWYTGDVIGRLKPEGRVIIINTRWHEDDLSGRLIAQGLEDWKVLSFEALCEDPENDPMGREIGQALWPEWEDEEKLLRKKSVMGSREWECQFQQHPIGKGVALIDADQIKMETTVPGKITSIVRAWDLAGTEQQGSNNPDWTVGLKLGRLEDGRHIVLDIRRGRWSPQDVENQIYQAAVDDGYETAIVIPQDAGQAGKAQAQSYVQKLAGYRVVVQLQTGSKTTRATPVIAQIEASQLLCLTRKWSTAFLDELGKFPTGTKDDQVDALSSAFNWMVKEGGSSAIIDYYREMSSADNKNILKAALQEAQSDYTAMMEEIMAESKDVCARCGQPFADGNRVTDGVTSWHSGC